MLFGYVLLTSVEWYMILVYCSSLVSVGAFSVCLKVRKLLRCMHAGLCIVSYSSVTAVWRRGTDITPRAHYHILYQISDNGLHSIGWRFAFKYRNFANHTIVCVFCLLESGNAPRDCASICWRLCVYVLQMFFILLFFCVFFRPSQKYQTPFSGTAERIFMKLLPNDSGENVVSNVVPKWGLGPQIIFWG